MKRLVKITALCLCVCIALCALASCGDSESGKSNGAYALYLSAETKTDSLTNYSAVTTQSISVDCAQDEKDVTLNTRTEIAVDFSDKDSPVSLRETEVERNGEKLASVLNYHKDGITYYKDNDACYKAEQSANEVVKSVSSAAGFGFPEAAFGAAKLSGADGSVRTITATAEKGLLDSFTEQFVSSVSELSDDGTYSISAVEMTLTVDENGYLSDIVLKFNVTFTSGGESARADTVLSFSYANPGERVEVEAPDGLDAYPDYGDYAASTETAADTSAASPDESADNGLTEKQGEAIDAAFALFDENYQPVANYDELYAAACAEYGKEMMDSLIDTITMFSSLG